ncbi:hypothetical protein ACFPAG_07685 [Vogesella sp. GCM10023246]|uniref:HTH crp-type domain-containing protein n=1 Tax=Vogesella oryzagri TaxID=3160864 RepID=A0ABV1M4A6_9NEIS
MCQELGLSKSGVQMALGRLEEAVGTGDLALVRNLLLNSELITACSPQQLHYSIRNGQIVPLPIDLGDTRRAIGLTQR